METGRERCFEHFNFRLEELAADNHAKKEGGASRRRKKAKPHIYREPRRALHARAQAEMLSWRFPS